MSAHVAGLVRATTPSTLSSSSATGTFIKPKPTKISSYSPLSHFLFLLIRLLLFSLSISTRATTAAETSPGTSQAPTVDALLRLKAGMSNTKALISWNSTMPPCTGSKSNWAGVRCWNGKVWGLQLEKMNLMGAFDMEALVPLINQLRSISLKNNNFNGPMPQVKKLGPLKSLFLSNNHFSGKIPDDAFSGMGSLKKVFLANNDFTGNIPSSIAALPRLIELRLEGNRFRGRIPDFPQSKSKRFRNFNVSNNRLGGRIPTSLSKMPISAFEGNEDLCGEPLYKSCERPSTLTNILIVMGVLVGLAIVIAIIFLLLRNQKTPPTKPYNEPPPAASLAKSQSRSAATYHNPNQVHHTKAPERVNSGGSSPRTPTNCLGRRTGGNEIGRLSFIRNDREKFDLQDLLRASAEVLGSGTFGSSYKAVVGNGQSLVVKRYKYLNCGGREEFHDSMRRLGRLNHPNLLPLVAYYYRKDEKLLICDFVPNGSLANQLHRNHTAEEPSLDWPTRLKIVRGIAKGLQYLYKELRSHTAPHGHLKSSNVLLDKSFDPILTDYALVPMINEENARLILVSYKSPEYANTGRITKKTDVWSLGIIILEILTGKFPENYLLKGHDSSVDLASWVNSMIKEKRTGEVFDPEMEGTKNCKGEMIKLLKIGLGCCQEDVDLRMDLDEVIEKLDDLKDVDSEAGSSPFTVATPEKLSDVSIG